MAIIRHALILCILLAAPRAQARDETVATVMGRDVVGGSDTKPTGRYQGSILLGQTSKAFDELILPTGPAQGSPWSDHKFSATVTPQGRVTRALYVAPAGRSTLEILTNYTDALQAGGFSPVFTCANDACGEAFAACKYADASAVIGPGYSQVRTYIVQAALQHPADRRYALYKRHAADGDSFVSVYVGIDHGGSHGGYSEALDNRPLALIEMVEPRPMEHKIVTVTADQIASKAQADGRVVFYGIFFDFNRADVKPDSDPQLAQMAIYLKANPGRVFITGHTDDKGGLDYNLALSQHRADAVAKILAARYTIDAKRLIPRGLASLSPLASNTTEEGRAKNRRVELVAE